MLILNLLSYMDGIRCTGTCNVRRMRFLQANFKEVIRSVRTYGGMSQESYIKQEAIAGVSARFCEMFFGHSRERYRDDALPEIGDSLSECCVKVIP